MKISNYKNTSKYKSGDLYFNVSKEVYNLRKFFNLTQEELADKIGTKQSGIARIESGATLPSLTTLKKIADVFGAKIESPRFVLGSKKRSLLKKPTRSKKV